MRYQGNPCWYELTTDDLPGAGAFYGEILGWEVADSGHPAFTYHLAKAGGGMIAGLMEGANAPDKPPHWLVYFAADDCDATTDLAVARGAKVLSPPADVPGTGRFAMLADPQGAVFGLLQPDMTGMSEAEIARAASGRGAFDPAKPGHAQWNELMSSDPEAGFTFYATLFGWTKGQAMDMGAMGLYQILTHRVGDIGAVMALGDAPFSTWLPYFGVDRSVRQVADRITALGGHIHHGPAEVPGGMRIAVAQDPQGAWFAILGPQ